MSQRSLEVPLPGTQEHFLESLIQSPKTAPDGGAHPRGAGGYSEACSLHGLEKNYEWDLCDRGAPFVGARPVGSSFDC